MPTTAVVKASRRSPAPKTLESKIRTLKVVKNRFRQARP